MQGGHVWVLGGHVWVPGGHASMPGGLAQIHPREDIIQLLWFILYVIYWRRQLGLPVKLLLMAFN